MPKIRDLSSLKQAMEQAQEQRQSVPALPEAPKAPIQVRINPMTLLRDQMGVLWYEEKRTLVLKDPDPFKDYAGPRFVPPTPKGQGRTKRFAQR